jgi:hypothetical protein
MNDESTKKERDPKVPYQSPQVVRVSLRPEEAVLGHCKISGHAGPISGGCGGALRCKSLGS